MARLEHQMGIYSFGNLAFSSHDPILERTLRDIEIGSEWVQNGTHAPLLAASTRTHTTIQPRPG